MKRNMSGHTTISACFGFRMLGGSLICKSTNTQDFASPQLLNTPPPPPRKTKEGGRQSTHTPMTPCAVCHRRTVNRSATIALPIRRRSGAAREPRAARAVRALLGRRWCAISGPLAHIPPPVRRASLLMNSGCVKMLRKTVLFVLTPEMS